VLLVVLLGTAAFYALRGAGLLPAAPEGEAPHLGLSLPWPTLGFAHGMGLALHYLPVALPLAFVTIVGGIDNAASAAAAGDAYDTRQVLLTEGVSTLLAGLF